MILKIEYVGNSVEFEDGITEVAFYENFVNYTKKCDTTSHQIDNSNYKHIIVSLIDNGIIINKQELREE